ncbi:MAG: ATP-dependent DNA helicase RecQ, partial [Limisphaerales bacterium]
SVCRRKFLLHYFGEEYDDVNCGGKCDNCRYPKDKMDGTESIITALKAVVATKEMQPIPVLVDFLLGKESRKVADTGHQELELFGAGKEKDDRFWNTILRQGLIHGLLHKGIENYGLISLTERGSGYLVEPWPIKIALNHDFSKLIDAPVESSGNKTVVDPVLLEMLRDLRRKIAQGKDLPPYVIFQDSSLEDMAIHYPITMDEMPNITGVSKGKAMKYGKKFMELIAKYVEENEIERPNEFVMKSLANKAGNKIFIILNIDKKVPLPDIAAQKNISMNELLDELDVIVSSGTRINIKYHLDSIVDEYQQEDAMEYFKTTTMDDVEAAYDELKEEGLSMEDVKLMRIKFLSEVGN